MTNISNSVHSCLALSCQQVCFKYSCVAGERLTNVPFSDFLLIEERPPTNRLIWNACKSNFSGAVACRCMRIFYCFQPQNLYWNFPCGCENTWWVTSRFFGVSRERKTIAEYWITFWRRNCTATFLLRFQVVGCRKCCCCRLERLSQLF